MTNRAAWIGAFVALLADQANAQLAGACSLVASDSPRISVSLSRVGKQELPLQIPEAYFASAVGGNSIGSHSAILLIADMDTMTPRPNGQLDGFYTRPKASFTRLSILIEDRYPADIVEANEIIGNYDAKRDGLPSSYAYKFGLSQLDRAGQKFPADLFVAESEDGVTDFFRCDPGYAHTELSYPQCGHYTQTVSGIPITLDYAKEYLPRWGEIKQKAAQFVECLTRR